MNVLFTHDHVFYKVSDQGVYSNGGLNKDIWDRYLKVFDHMEVFSRGKEVNEEFINKKSFTLSSRDNVTFNTLPNLSSLKGKIVNRKISKGLLTEAIKKNDALIARIPSEIGYLSIEIAKKLNKPWLVEVVSDPFDDLWNYGTLTGKLYAPISFLKMRKLVRDSPYAIYVSKEALQRRYPSNGKTENCSNVKLQNLDKSVLKKRIDKINKIDKDYSLTLGLIGAVNNRRKGIDVAIKAISILKKDINIKLKILGGGDSAIWSKLIDKYKLDEHIEFCGIVPSGEPVYNWIDDIDIYIQPSYGEGLPRSIIEAMSRGCPVIASSVGAIPELVNNKFMHKPSDYKSLAKLIHCAYKNKGILLKMSADNFKISQQYEESFLDHKRTEFLNAFKREELDE